MINIFLSRPNSLSCEQEKTIDEIEKLLISRGMAMRTIGTTDFPNVAPMLAVEQVMNECAGIIVLGFPQIHVLTGTLKKDTKQQMNIKNKKIPTTWNHIETTIAFLLKIPMLIIRDENLDGGVFDVGTTGHFIHTLDLNSQVWIKEQKFLQPFNNWHTEVIEHNKKNI